MHTVHPNTLVTTVPDVKSGEYMLLPTAPAGDRGISFLQFGVILTTATAMFADQRKTWGEAMPLLRKEYRLSASRHTFVLVDAIIKRSRASTAHESLSPAQDETLQRIMSVLCGRTPHFDVGIRAAVDQLPLNVKTTLLNLAVGAETKGQASTVIGRWIALTGEPSGVRTPPDPEPSANSVPVGGEEAF